MGFARCARPDQGGDGEVTRPIRRVEKSRMLTGLSLCRRMIARVYHR